MRSLFRPTKGDARGYAGVRWTVLGGDINREAVANDRLTFAAETVRWYRRKKRTKRRLSNIARVLATVLLVVGGAIPLISPLISTVDARWGYPALAGSAGFLLIDRAFGWSRDWARYMLAATRIEAAAELYRIGALNLLDVQQSDDTVFVELSKDFTSVVNKIVEKETADWDKEHVLALGELEKLTKSSGR